MRSRKAALVHPPIYGLENLGIVARGSGRLIAERNTIPAGVIGVWESQSPCSGGCSGSPRANEAVSIANLSWPLPRPSYLGCPPGYCAAADMPSPIFDMPWDQFARILEGNDRRDGSDPGGFRV